MKKIKNVVVVCLVWVSSHAQTVSSSDTLTVLDGEHISDNEILFPSEYLYSKNIPCSDHKLWFVSYKGIDRVLVVNFEQSTGISDKFYWRMNGKWCLIAEADRITLLTLVGSTKITINAHTEIDFLSDKFIRQKTKKCDC